MVGLTISTADILIALVTAGMEIIPVEMEEDQKDELFPREITMISVGKPDYACGELEYLEETPFLVI